MQRGLHLQKLQEQPREMLKYDIFDADGKLDLTQSEEEEEVLCSEYCLGSPDTRMTNEVVPTPPSVNCYIPGPVMLVDIQE